MSKTAQVTARYLRHAPRKVRAIADLVRGLSVNEAEAQLMLNPRRASQPVLKALRSVVANAKELKMNLDNLVIQKIWVDGGPMLHRSLPRARGSASEIQKKMSHLSIIVGESDRVSAKRFTIAAAKKSKKHMHSPEKPDKEKKHIDSKSPAGRGEKSKDGFVHRVFRRKTAAGE